MEIKMLSYKKEEKSICFLCEGTFKEYLEYLPNDYSDYEIQRGIVTNMYLDTIWKDIILKHHIPPITLISDEIIDKKNQGKVTIKQYRILDGLQRTFRIKKIYNILKLISENKDNLVFGYPSIQSIRKEYKSELEDMEIKAKEILDVIHLVNDKSINWDTIMEIFNEKQWFEIWCGLSYKDEVNKMLILNAGHKPMSNYHQLELLFLNQLPKIQKKYSYITIIRGRDMTPLSYAKNRKEKEFYFAHLIESMISFIEKESITLNANLLKKLQQGDTNETFFLLNNEDFIYDFMDFIIKLDEHLNKNYSSVGNKWISKDTVLSAILATLSNERENDETSGYIFNHFISILEENPGCLNITSFDEERSSMDISAINIGKFTKKCVQTGISKLLKNPHQLIDWNGIFNSEREE